MLPAIPCLYGPLKPGPANAVIGGFGLLFSNPLAPHPDAALGP